MYHPKQLCSTNTVARANSYYDKWHVVPVEIRVFLLLFRKVLRGAWSYMNTHVQNQTTQGHTMVPAWVFRFERWR